MDMDQARETAKSIAQRVQSDPGFKQQVESDPQGTLTAAGLPESTVNEFMHEGIAQKAIETDVSGYSHLEPDCSYTCAFTCLFSGILTG